MWLLPVLPPLPVGLTGCGFPVFLDLASLFLLLGDGFERVDCVVRC